MTAVSPESPFGPGGGDAGSPFANLQANLNGAGGAGSGGAFINPDDPPVSLGRKVTVPSGKPMPDGMKLPGKKVADTSSMPLSAAQASIYSWTEDEWKALAKRLWYLGYAQVSDPSDVQGAIGVWQSAVAEAAKMQAGGHSMTPDDVLELYSGSNAKTRADRAAGGLQSTKDRTVSLTDPVQARAMIEQAFQQAMGRDPTDAEVRVLTDSLHKAQRDNPATSTTSPQFDSKGNPIAGATQTVNQASIDPSAFIQQAAQNDPEAAQFQAGTARFAELMQALSSPL